MTHIQKAIIHTFLLVIVGCSPFFVSAQSKFRIITSDRLESNDALGYFGRQLVGNVKIGIEDAILHSDSVIFNEKKNFFEAFNGVNIIQGDSISTFCQTLHYDGETKMIKMVGNVKMNHQESTLTTPVLYVDRNKDIAYFLDKGILVKGQDTLWSDRGFFHLKTEDFHFSKNTIYKSPDSYIVSDSMSVNNKTQNSRFYKASRIIQDGDTIYCNQGYYNQKTHDALFHDGARVISSEQSLSADSIQYNTKTRLGEANGNVMATLPGNDMTVVGDRGYFDSQKDSSSVWGNSHMIQVSEQDSFIISSDTLISYKPSLKDSNRQLMAYPDVSIYSEDFKGRADYIFYSTFDSTFHLRGEPVLWASENQLTARDIQILTKDSRPHRLFMNDSAFITSSVNEERFNQIKGDSMVGNFKENELRQINVYGNGKVIYYIKEDNGDYQGVNKAECKNLKIIMDKAAVDKVVFLAKPVAKFMPIEGTSTASLIYPGHQWLIALKPEKPSFSETE